GARAAGDRESAAAPDRRGPRTPGPRHLALPRRVNPTPPRARHPPPPRSFDVSPLGREIVDPPLPLLGCARATLFELSEGAYRLVAVARADGVEAADDLAGPELGPVEA